MRLDRPGRTVRSRSVPSSIAGFVLTVVAQYGLNRRWTFRSQARRSPEFVRYAAVSLSGLGLNALVMYVCADWLSLHYAVGQAIAMTAIPLSNFWLNRRWTFRGGDPAETPARRIEGQA
ncbi:GtrA family protein [Paenibacillus sp. GYB003]|uniref:GtrA family protein n=1 Tax=Paenibacillus sp. GYB003 TaxID=2994392 RepID=UPI002F963245